MKILEKYKLHIALAFVAIVVAIVIYRKSKGAGGIGGNGGIGSGINPFNLKLLNNKNETQNTTNTTPTSTGTYSKPSAKVVNENFPIKKGHYGQRVKFIQEYLRDVKKRNIVADGDFGTDTENALLAALGVKEVTSSKFIQITDEARRFNANSSNSGAPSLNSGAPSLNSGAPSLA